MAGKSCTGYFLEMMGHMGKVNFFCSCFFLFVFFNYLLAYVLCVGELPCYSSPREISHHVTALREATAREEELKKQSSEKSLQLSQSTQVLKQQEAEIKDLKGKPKDEQTVVVDLSRGVEGAGHRVFDLENKLKVAEGEAWAAAVARESTEKSAQESAAELERCKKELADMKMASARKRVIEE